MQSSVTPATTQRRLVLIRHAKAVEDDVGGDHARPLSDRGADDAAALGEWLKASKLLPDSCLCSTAARTRQTLAAFNANIPTILSDKLYLASPGEMLAAIQQSDDAVGTLMLIGHNPGAHALLALLVGEYANEDDADKVLLKFSTSACAVLEFRAARWRDVAPQTGKLTKLRD